VSASHGLVIGKFYPPHSGHHHLVRVAASQCARLTVVVMASSGESLSLADRVAWMREVHSDDARISVAGIADDHPVNYEDDAIWSAHVALMREAARSVTSGPVDAVFTSEPYGEELGRRLSARHVLVDLERTAQAISGTAVRADPVAHWARLAPCVRAHLGLRVVLVGAESTGKTTLAEELAAALQARAATHGAAYAATRWVHEAGRDVTLEKLARLGENAAMESLVWETPDFVEVARRQAALEAAAARESGPVLVCDTDAFATGIWHERYVGSRSAEVEQLGAPAPSHLYLLTHPDDVPFTDDGARDGAEFRDWMTERFVTRLGETTLHWAWLRGRREERLQRALALIDDTLARVFWFAAPLG
jgi:NadR type nicotinamide-nucleotide adenylyltransferase